MKIIAKKIDMLATFMVNKEPRPLKFRLCEDDSYVRVVIKVEKVISISENKNAGKKSLIYRCQSIIDGYERQYELKYKIDNYTWELYKM